VRRPALHPLLRRLFEALEQHSIRWLLLRIPSVPAAPSGDVDLLVTPGDAHALRAVANRFGFVAVPGWDAPPRLILMCFDRDSGRWLVLDVSTSVSFPAARWELEPALSDAVLGRRRTTGRMALPADEDGFWLLLLHCLFDKQQIASHYRPRLRELAGNALKSDVGRAACAAAGGRCDPAALVALVRAERWERLAEVGTRLAAEIRRRTPLGRRLRHLVNGLAALARKPFLVPRRRGLILALLGPNGVGKSTAAAGLQASLPFESRILYMGLWKASNRRPGRARGIGRVATRPVWIWGRYLVAQYHQLRGRVVIFDRYVYEALLPPQPPLVVLKRAYFWSLAHLVPEPTAVVVLDVAGSVAYGRKQENPPEELERERVHYAQLGAKLSSVELVDAEADPDAVRAHIAAIIWRELRTRWRDSPGDSR
jgi:thymidylate kinase